MFGTIKGLLLFVCTQTINKTCFYKIKGGKAVSVLSRTASEKPKHSEYLPHWLDKHSIYRKLWITTLKRNNLNRKQKLFHYKIPKDAFLSKGASNEETASQDHHQMHGWSKMQLFPKHWELLVTLHAPTSPWCSAWSTVTCMLMRANKPRRACRPLL